MEFQVPQFTEHEAKILGPLTFRQIIYVGTGGGIGLFLYHTLPFPFSCFQLYF